MKFLKILRYWETQLHNKLNHAPLLAKSILPLGIIIVLCEAIWIIGDKLTFFGINPFGSNEKRLYAMLCLFLLWFLKFLLVDVTYLNVKNKDSKLQKKLATLQQRFDGAIIFLKKNILKQTSQASTPNETPWLLLIGPPCAGKTSLLANANVNFILRKQTDNLHITPSENLDWWVTEDACIIDVPSHYLFNSQKQEAEYSYKLWQYFLKLIKHQRGKSGINGIIIALPAFEYLQKKDKHDFSEFWHHFIKRLQLIKQMFPEPIVCQLVITKCDLCPGFKEFFAEAAIEEVEQIFGVHLLTDKKQNLIELFNIRFNALIKKINKQLIWRLHQERNPLMRPFVKDFPLQLEHLKIFIIDFLKKIQLAGLPLNLNSVYLTSAIQPKEQHKDLVIEEFAETQQLQIYQHPHTCRPHFIKQFLELGLHYKPVDERSLYKASSIKRRLAYTFSLMIILASGYFLAKDFGNGIKTTYAVQKDLVDFQTRIASISDPLEHLTETIKLLNMLQPPLVQKTSYFKMSDLLQYFSKKADRHHESAYQKVLFALLIPECAYFLEEYLKTPINKEANDIYIALQDYLMLGDVAHLNPKIFVEQFIKILPQQLNQNEKDALINHLNILLKIESQPIKLNDKIVLAAREYLFSLPKLKLAYIILKNSQQNDSLLTLAYDMRHAPLAIPKMFTANSFIAIMSNQLSLATKEALQGNWILGYHTISNQQEMMIPMLIEDLKKIYIQNYSHHWENMLSQVTFSADTLVQLDELILTLAREPSILMQLLQIVQNNTAFEPILSASGRLQAIHTVGNQEPTNKKLQEILSGLEAVHNYLQPLLNTTNKKKTAYDMLSIRMMNQKEGDPLIQLRQIADKNPEPIKSWLINIANLSSRFLTEEATKYIDITWQNEVIKFYNKEIANRYPFASANHPDVDVEKFVAFFSHTGILLSYFNHILKPFVDTTLHDWRWKNDGIIVLPFNEDVLRQLQLAFKIHQSFFPKQDDNLNVTFILQLYSLGKSIKNVTLNINNKLFIDDNNIKQNHIISWPTKVYNGNTSISLLLNNRETINQYYPGQWGWLKLIDHGFESMISKKQFRLNLSMNENPVKYLLLSETSAHPFSMLNLKHFHLPARLLDDK